jgi:hypothetical protein
MLDIHAEAQARFTEATTPVRSNQTMTDNVLKGIDIGVYLVDQIQTHDFERKGTCHEVDPIARPFVHYVPFQVVGSAAMAYVIERLHPGPLATIALGVFGVGESLNVYHNHRIGCE